jgi:hypothetical protein
MKKVARFTRLHGVITQKIFGHEHTYSIQEIDRFVQEFSAGMVP